MSSSKSKSEIWLEWNDLINIAPKELEEWLGTDQSRSVGDKNGEESTGHASGRRIVTIKRTNKDDISDDQWDHMAKVVRYVKRHLAQSGPDDDKESSNWRYSLMNWSHDPMKNSQ